MQALGRRRPRPAIGILAALCLLGAILSACSTNDADGSADDGAGPGPTITRPEPSGEPRTVRIGFSTLPPERTVDSYINAFATAAQYGDVVLIQRAPPWSDFMPGGGVSAATQENTELETSLHEQYSNLQLFYAIDPTDGIVERTRIANLPSSVDPEIGFNDPDLREAFIAYTTYVVKNYKPDYLALGVEVNMMYERKRDQFDAFVSLYHEAYRIAKENRPEMKVFPTFQLEDLEGTFAEIHPPHWEVIDPFRDAMDALAISTYPFLGDIRSATEIREDYYSQLREHWDGEIVISETGYASGPVEGKAAVGTEEAQRTYLERILNEAEANHFGFVIWLAALDPSFVNTGAASVFRDIGLRHSDGANKLAWPTWEEWARRPLGAG
ncbi:MAG: hypothetical protein ACM3S1_10255 [Hyphomicrobiales bacterium]